MFNLIMDHLIFDPKLHPFGSLVANIDFIIIMQIWRAAGKTDYCRSLSLCFVHRMEDYVASKRATALYSSREEEDYLAAAKIVAQASLKRRPQPARLHR